MAVKKIHGPKLFKWQADSLKLYQDHPKNSIITISSPRQRGKSMFLQTLVTMECVNHRNYRTYIIVPSYLTARKQFNEMTRSLGAIPGLLKSKNSQFFDIELTNGSTISFRSILSGDSLRGNTAELLIIDEGSFVDLDTAMTTVFPYTNTTGGDIIIASTPKLPDEEGNLFAKFFFAGMRGEPGCYTINWNSYDTSALMPREKMELLRKSMPFNIFSNEIEGLFLSLKSDLWDIEPVLSKTPGIKTRNMSAGIDWGAGTEDDETSISLFNDNNEMTKLIHFNDKSPVDTVKFIANILEQFGVTRCCLELNSIGQVYFDMLKREVAAKKLRCQLIPFNTTNTSKREIIESLQVLIQNQAITLLDEHYLKLQFASFVMKTTKSGLITYENSSDTVHDDIVMSVALAQHAAKKSGYIIR